MQKKSSACGTHVQDGVDLAVQELVDVDRHAFASGAVVWVGGGAQPGQVDVHDHVATFVTPT
jgi:hypothetical protein